uniref:PARP catalytic domain-containing protein n=1 Tax=Gadus morhua TaxID=8049 RepID=A0A8C5A2L6_GADMO
MSHQQSYSWEEDDFQLPTGVKKIEEGFRQSAGGMLGRGVYLSRDMNKARAYPIDPKVNVNVGNVIAINRQGHPRQNNWHDSGYGEEDCVWDPSRIKMTSVSPRPLWAESRFLAPSKISTLDLDVVHSRTASHVPKAILG